MPKNKGKTGLITHRGHQPSPEQMELFSVKEVTFDGVVMGVMSDGTPYLSLRGLARMCGVDHAVIQRMSSNWSEDQNNPRGRKIKSLLEAQGHSGESLSIVTKSGDRNSVAFTDAVCMAFLEYYAFEAKQGSNEVAIRNYRLLARQSCRNYIYAKCGYDPSQSMSAAWVNYHARVLLNQQIPHGFFCVFRELADLIVPLINAGMRIDDHTIPDISVGRRWSDEWKECGYDGVFGLRKKYPHVYPDWFPQADAGPQEAWIYPVEALGDFRNWLAEKYIPLQFPQYIDGKVKRGEFIPQQGQRLIAALAPLAIVAH